MVSRRATGFDDVTAPSGAEVEDRPLGYRLVAIERDATREFLLRDGHTASIGRHRDATLSIRDESVSRLHAELRAGATLEVRDTGSRNGVFVNGGRIAKGAWVEVPRGATLLVGSVTIAVERARAPSEAARPTRLEVRGGQEPSRLIDSAAMRPALELVATVAPTDVSVLIIGETGAGKELFAEEIHRQSKRSRARLLRINCASFTAQLLESELFGHERGAFTGASSAKVGLIESANGGTVFFDEIAEMPLDLQARLLRVLEDRRVRPVGAVSERAVDVRFIAATHQPLEELAKRGAFRKDLFYRLAGVVIEVPPLRERREEIPALIERFAAAVGAQPVRVSPAAMELLSSWDWPGNVRELRNVVERAALLAAGREIGAEHLPRALVRRDSDAATPAAPKMRSELEALERQRIVEALARCNGNQSRAAAMIGMPRRTFVARLDAYGIPRPRKGAADES